jgi:glyoxylase-like metal-dependent hydrolase (beta-lactamase superfamily II)
VSRSSATAYRRGACSTDSLSPVGAFNVVDGIIDHELLGIQNIPRDVACVINTHLHFDHCGGNRLFPGVPIHVQARELADGRSLDDYTIRECVDFDGATYISHEGEVEVLPGMTRPAFERG